MGDDVGAQNLVEPELVFLVRGGCSSSGLWQKGEIMCYQWMAKKGSGGLAKRHEIGLPLTEDSRADLVEILCSVSESETPTISSLQSVVQQVASDKCFLMVARKAHFSGMVASATLANAILRLPGFETEIFIVIWSRHQLKD
ncbi:hypothetical protein CISG_10226 [Coccidioides immitis RMSCC 3703]|uniref:Uncharacterized protein n=1 Tax=Coccidioides immitis RMSCC 3703 TaxID=454286 RepID=A0A0J8QN37_COCIT|nr:hypothetical protein CISG_10226 [Coccidioides immitis RMSCC 3703]